MIPDLIRPSPSARQAGANRALEGAVTMADDAQSKAPGYCSVISLSVVVIRIRHLLRVGIRVKCLSRNVDRGGQQPRWQRSSGGGRGRRHHHRRMLGTWWGARSPSAACIGGRRQVPKVAGVVGVGRAPREGRQTSTHHVEIVVVKMVRTPMVLQMSI